MATYAFLFAAVALLAAAALWYLDSLQRRRLEPPEEFAAPAEPEQLRTNLSLPGALRRERKAWAEEKGFDFARSDEYLNDEWSRGVASAGAVAKDIVSGHAYGHELLLMDLGGVNVMAMRRGSASDVVVDIRRGEVDSDSEDLFEAIQVGDFRIFATDTGVAQRLIDQRITTALEVMPGTVTAVWMEADWVLAQTDRGTHAADWDDMLAPLALLADAAHALPPRATATQVLNLDGLDPTRQMPVADAPGFTLVEQSRLVAEVEPVVQRPEEPLTLPTRMQPVARGVVKHSDVGTDTVNPIGDGSAPTQRGTSMPRDLSRGSSIFDDGAN
ncbi:hypothetical protein CATRI_11935 [Corynebacterium atrinae]|uniref:hypothetical protein n=1 Tax=Corynebacterium atrinae TaxID=1336740 RepID=UPI0025B41DFC|nr:hypothetical protein [Corynebacterium atrinae]WJY64436.1 hypothetical protein CATRI_11935 [Corynebacterium atrinae]